LDSEETLVQILLTNKDKKYSAFISVSTPPFTDYLSQMLSTISSGQIIDFTSHLKQNLLNNFVTATTKNIHINHIISNLDTDPQISTIEQQIQDSTMDKLIEKFIPSRSYLKLLELEIRYPEFFKIIPGQLIADLGSSPGGWTLYSLLKGGRVVSIDKSQLDFKYFDLSDKNLHFLEQDAFEFNNNNSLTTTATKSKTNINNTTTTQFDWLIIDMKVHPKKTLELLEIWLKEKKCKHFVVNLKYIKTDFIMETDRFIQSNIIPNCSFINSHCLDTNGEYELTLFGTNLN